MSSRTEDPRSSSSIDDIGQRARVGGGMQSSRLAVLVVVDQLRRAVPGGIGTYALGLLAGLRQAAVSEGSGAAGGRGSRGPEVSLLAGRPSRHAAGGLPLTADPLAGLGFGLRTSVLRGRALIRSWDLGVAGAPRGFAVVHAVSTAAPALRGGRSSLVVTVHDLAWRHHPEATTRRGRRWHEAALHRALRRADAFVVPSSSVAEDLVAAGANPDRVAVIVEGSDHLPDPDPHAASVLLQGAGVHGDYLLSVSTLEPRKNLRRLLSAYGRARRLGAEPLPLVVVGPTGWGDAALETDLAASEGVALVGAVTAEVLAALYARARLFVYVPLTEGYGLPPLEAMRCGAPVVASATVPSVFEGVVDHPAAIGVDPLDVDAIAEGLIRGSADESLRAELVQRGFEWSSERTWRATADAHVELWEQLG